MSSVIPAVLKAGLEGFINPEDSREKKESYINVAAVLISFVIALVIISLIGKLLWNSVVCELISVARPAKSFVQMVGLFVFVALISC